jgi:hypothetical protein
MTLIRTMAGLGLLSLLSACATQPGPQQLTDDTRRLGILLQGIETSNTAFKAQRDKIDAAAQIQRNNLLEIALRQENDLAQTTLGWKVAGQAGHQRMFETLQTEMVALASRDEEQRQQAAARADALAKLKSAVAIDNDKISAAAQKLASLGEDPGRSDQLKFLFDFAKDVRDDIKKNEPAQQGAKP